MEKQTKLEFKEETPTSNSSNSANAIELNNTIVIDFSQKLNEIRLKEEELRNQLILEKAKLLSSFLPQYK